jgi:ElaB/YqjD/DUF883 family membrane-anchored ribosome-binding protein
VVIGASPGAPSVGATPAPLPFGGEAEAKPERSSLPAYARITASVLVGVMGAVALTGCNPSTPAASSTSQTQADKQLDAAFARAEKAIEGAKSGDAKAAAQAVTRDLVTQIRDYAKTSGKSAAEVSAKIKDYAIAHPAVSITILLAAGVTSGVVLEKYGVPETVASAIGSAVTAATSGASNGLSAIEDYVKAHPFVSAAVGVAAAAAVGYLVYQAVTPAAQAPAPVTPEQKNLVASLDNLEQEATTAKGDTQNEAQSINKRFMDRVADYAKQTGKSAREVADDVGQYMISHPAVSAAVILAAGTTAGVVLEHAGVPEKVAAVAGAMVDSVRGNASEGLGTVATAVKNHPVMSGTIAAALAAGAGYVIYQHATAAPQN